MRSFSTTQKAILALIIANIIWGAAPPIFKWSLRDIHPFTLAFLRFGIAALIFLPFAARRLSIQKSDILKVIFIGIFGITLNISFFFLGLELAPSINASIIGSSGPIFIIVASLLYLKERPKNKVVLGGLLGLLGVFVLLFVPLFDGRAKLAALGNLFYILGVLGTVAQTILARKIMHKYTATTIAFWAFFVGTVTFIPFFTNEVLTFGFLPNLTYQGITGILFGALLSSAVAYFFLYWALKALPATEVSIFVYIDPVVTVLIAIPLLGEIPNTSFLLGAILVFGGIFIAEGRLHWHPLHKLRF